VSSSSTSLLISSFHCTPNSARFDSTVAAFRETRLAGVFHGEPLRVSPHKGEGLDARCATGARK
jgi:hypothetical protein